jgi:endogenous inhibitor of DNA gyrase (YacG/DUF329 family)
MASKRTIAERAADPICPNCGASTAERAKSATFCSDECKIAHYNRHVKEGRAMVAWAKAWRIDRGSGEIAKGALDQLCNIVDTFNREDAEAGRPRADLYAAKLLRGGSLYADRRSS